MRQEEARAGPADGMPGDSCSVKTAPGTKGARAAGPRSGELEPVHGFAAETAAGLTIQGAALLGIPLSTTHTIGTAIGVWEPADGCPRSAGAWRGTSSWLGSSPSRSAA